MLDLSELGEKRRSNKYTVPRYPLAGYPLAGDVIKGTGGVRKVRWGKDGSGKRSGVRVIYIHVEVDGTVTLIAVYAKNVKENILNKEIKRLQND